ncbi:MAG: hypothetical protein WD850_02425 [Candidatus Spechtbacterales bacterium]
MNHQPNNTFTVIALGGSIVVPGTINVSFLKRLRAFLIERMNAGEKFILVVGGGKTTRVYQQAAAQAVDVSDEDMDWLGLHATRLNGHLVRAVFYDHAYPVMLDDPAKPIAKDDLERFSLLVGAGSRPGWSTDYVAMLLANRFKTKKVLIATTIPYVLNKDPKYHRNVRPLRDLTWTQYRAMVGDAWTPGMKTPVDPIAAKFAQEHEMTCSVLRGTNLKNLERYLDGKPFKGSVIHP